MASTPVLPAEDEQVSLGIDDLHISLQGNSDWVGWHLEQVWKPDPHLFTNRVAFCLSYGEMSIYLFVRVSNYLYFSSCRTFQ